MTYPVIPFTGDLLESAPKAATGPEIFFKKSLTHGVILLSSGHSRADQSLVYRNVNQQETKSIHAYPAPFGLLAGCAWYALFFA